MNTKFRNIFLTEDNRKDELKILVISVITSSWMMDEKSYANFSKEEQQQEITCLSV